MSDETMAAEEAPSTSEPEDVDSQPALIPEETAASVGSSVIEHPAYLTAMQEILSLRAQVKELEEAEREKALLQVQLDTLTKTVENQAHALELAKVEAGKQDEAAVAALASGKIQLERLRKDYEEQRRELEVTVVRYAVSEQAVIKAKEEALANERKVLEAKKELEAVQKRLKAATIDRSKADKDFDLKCNEVMAISREKEKLRDDLHNKETKIKWAHNRITQEMDAHKETQEKLDKVSAIVQQAQDEAEQAKQDALASVTAFKQAHAEKMSSLESQVHELKAQLIVAVTNEDARKVEQKEANEAALKIKKLEDENGVLSGRVLTLEAEKIELRHRVSDLVKCEQEKIHLEDELASVKAEFENTRTELEQRREEVEAAASDAAAWRAKETELLSYTQQLTDKLVAVQSEAIAADNKAQQLEADHQPLVRQNAELEQQLAKVREELEVERQARSHDVQLLSRKVAENQEAAERASAKLEEVEGECAVLKRKQQLGTKELTRELQQCRRRLEQLEAGGSLGSRTNSSSSLEDNNQTASTNGGTVEPQMLIEHIGKLQNKNSKLNEKVEFLEEHSRTLLLEVQRKTKLVQELVLRQETGALSSRAHDLNKLDRARKQSQVRLIWS
ncbi:coiled-coil domain-containing protein 186 isoform X2 [Neocloeon triangulifer]|uniref:coiled-coil domain-containing protein 186 isoform X2 n=1 Tax=Neocloeon triangulifer TaxID=2078957 RepID=UPI00286F7BFC|nr:coiled-coil domain-containing protein 186 isoform X2 [Neocloeon triangulifer]